MDHLANEKPSRTEVSKNFLLLQLTISYDLPPELSQTPDNKTISLQRPIPFHLADLTLPFRGLHAHVLQPTARSRATSQVAVPDAFDLRPDRSDCTCFADAERCRRCCDRALGHRGATECWGDVRRLEQVWIYEENPQVGTGREEQVGIGKTLHMHKPPPPIGQKDVAIQAGSYIVRPFCFASPCGVAMKTSPTWAP